MRLVENLKSRFVKPKEESEEEVPPPIIMSAPQEKGLLPSYCTVAPSMQSALDIFKGHWKSKLPAEFGLQAGEEPMFEDKRVHWANSIIPGGIAQKSILELGPFEAYNSYHFQQLNAGDVVAVEGNNINFLKCLLLKQALGLKAEFLHGDFCEYLKNTSRRFDIIWASGVLYHQREPLEFLARVAEHTDTVFFWTHYYDDRVLNDHNAAYFSSEKNTEKSYAGYRCPHYYRSYNLPSAQDIPLYFEGGNEMFAHWLALEDIYAFLKQVGLKKITLQHQGDLNGLPVISFLATRSA